MDSRQRQGGGSNDQPTHPPLLKLTTAAADGHGLVSLGEEMPWLNAFCVYHTPTESRFRQNNTMQQAVVGIYPPLTGYWWPCR